MECLTLVVGRFMSFLSIQFAEHRNYISGQPTKKEKGEVIAMIIDKSSTWREGFIERLENREAWDNWTLFKMSYEIAKKNLITDFRGL